jgi:hypothetical protein
MKGKALQCPRQAEMCEGHFLDWVGSVAARSDIIPANPGIAEKGNRATMPLPIRPSVRGHTPASIIGGAPERKSEAPPLKSSRTFRIFISYSITIRNERSLP